MLFLFFSLPLFNFFLHDSLFNNFLLQYLFLKPCLDTHSQFCPAGGGGQVLWPVALVCPRTGPDEVLPEWYGALTPLQQSATLGQRDHLGEEIVSTHFLYMENKLKMLAQGSRVYHQTTVFSIYV